MAQESSDARSKPIGVAVVVVNYNGGPHLERCLEAVLAQTVPPRRIFVVDNASNDGSAERALAQGPRVEVIRCDQNLGFARANNIGFNEASDCEWIACLNPDAFPDPQWLEHVLEAAEQHPEYAFFGSKLLKAEDEGVLDGTGDVYHVCGLAWRRDHGRAEAESANDDGEIFAPCAAAALYRRDVLCEVGGFDESFFCYFEDIDLALRLRLRGHRCCYVSRARVRHVGSAITGRRSDFSIYHGHRNLVWAYFKNMPSPLFWLYLPLHLALNIASVFAYSFTGQAAVILRAKRDAVAGLRRILQVRKQVQASRRIPVRGLDRVMVKSVTALLTRK